MKKITLLFAILITTLSFSQTTNDEYNYMIKGYQIQVSSGLDMKKGYQIENLTVINKGNYTFDFKALLRSNNTLAGVLVVATSKAWGNTYYIGMPVSNPNLTPYYENEIAKWDEPMTTAYANAVSELYANVLNSFLIKLVEDKK